jgi:hypothetical protein
MSLTPPQPTPNEEDKVLETLTLEDEMALRRARRLLEFIRVVYENEAQIVEKTVVHPVDSPSSDD